MAEELKVGHARPTGGPVGETAHEQTPITENIAKSLTTLFVKRLHR